jgi:folate-binding protein YgfZ
MTTAQLIPLPHLAILDISGEDAQTFLQNQVPSDIRLLSPEKAQISGWCTAKGRLLTTFVIWPQNGGYRLVLAADVRDSIAKRLKMYVLRLKVQIHVSEDQVFGLLNLATSLGALKLPTEDWQLVTQISTTGDINAVRLDATRCLLTGPASGFAILSGEFALGSSQDWLRSDIAQGFPLVSLATSEHYVPQMVNLDKLGGVSFKKGCYPGQEIVARTHYLGKIKRHLYRVSASEALHAGQEVRATALNGQSCGSLVTVAPSADGQSWLALAVLQEDAAEGAIYCQKENDAAAIPLHLSGLV